MTTQEAIQLLQLFPSDSEVQIRAQDYFPKLNFPVSFVIDANGDKTATNPLIIFYAGSNGLRQYDSSGYGLKNFSGISSVPILSGSGSPVGVAAASSIGQFYVDKTTPALWQSTGLGNMDWNEIV